MKSDNWSFKAIFKNQTKLAVYIIICTTIVVISASFALFFQVDTNSNNQVIEVGDLTFIYSNNSVISDSTCYHPMSAEETMLYANECSYQLSITNTGTLIADYNLFLVPREDNTADLSNLKLLLRENGALVAGYPKGIVSGTGDATHVGTTNSFLTGSINPGDTVLYSAQIYVDDTTGFASSVNKKVSFDIRGALVASDLNPVAGYKPYEATLHRLQALNSNYVVTPSTSVNPDFSKIAPSTSDGQTSGIFETEDDYGVSYYLRGDIDYNYVKFGKWQQDHFNGYMPSYNNYGDTDSVDTCSYSGTTDCIRLAKYDDDMYWRIIRINGDGSIRMIYDGTSAHGKGDLENTELELFRGAGFSAFKTNNSDNAYVGFKFGTAGSNNYNDTHANNSDISIKKRLDSWYQTHMLSYTDYISDTLFCNDRSLASSETINYVNTTSNKSLTANGYSNTNTLYAPQGRLIEEFSRGLGNKATLRCPQENDRFTVSDTTYGNAGLTYPVGLITIDELNMAGIGLSVDNSNSYLKTGKNYWTMSPAYFEDGYANVHYVSGTGALSSAHVMEYSFSLRPVINIKPNAIKVGSGTAQDPFRFS